MAIGEDNFEAYLKPTKQDATSVAFRQGELCYQPDYQYTGVPRNVEPFQMPTKSLTLFMPKMRPDDEKPEVSTPSTVHSAFSCDANDANNTEGKDFHSIHFLQHNSVNERKQSFFEHLFPFKIVNKHSKINPQITTDSTSIDNKHESDAQIIQKTQIKPGAINSLRNVFIL
jgi:hypothetical protein